MKSNTAKLSPLLLAISLLSSVSPLKAVAGEYESLFIFGDSLSDNGNLYRLTGNQFPPSPPYFQGRFSNGQVWAELFGTALEIDTNATANFAIGGSTSGTTNALSGLLGTTLPSLTAQINQYVASPGTADKNALFVVWAGANDYLIRPPELRLTDSQVAVNNLTTAVNALIGKGARNIIVPNLPNLGQTPQEQLLGTTSSSTAITNSHNSNLNTALRTIARNNPKVNIILLDINALFASATTSPAQFGYTNVTAPCFNQLTNTICTNPDEHLFWDGLHPTAKTHRVISEYAASVLAAPQAVVPQGDIALNVAQRQVQLIDARLQALRNPTPTPSQDRTASTSTSEQKLGAFINGNINFGDKDNSDREPGYDFNTSGVTAGVDYRVTDNLAFGVALGYNNNDTDFKRNRGKVEVDGYAVSLYSNYLSDNFYANGIVSFGGNNYDIERKTGFNNRKAKADTDGDQFSVGLNSGYVAKSGNISYGPTIGLRYDKVNIDGYTEKGAGVVNMKVDDQEAESLVLSLGAQASVNLGQVIPNVRVSYEHQFIEPTPRSKRRGDSGRKSQLG